MRLQRVSLWSLQDLSLSNKACRLWNSGPTCGQGFQSKSWHLRCWCPWSSRSGRVQGGPFQTNVKQGIWEIALHDPKVIHNLLFCALCYDLFNLLQKPWVPWKKTIGEEPSMKHVWLPFRCVSNGVTWCWCMSMLPRLRRMFLQISSSCCLKSGWGRSCCSSAMPSATNSRQC